MGKVLNFWTESEAIDLFFYIYPEATRENLHKYLTEYAPWLLKHESRIWHEINL